jgi:hypothetical protein
VVFPSGTIDLNDLSLPKLKNSAKQVVTHFLRELEEYFALLKGTGRVFCAQENTQ